MQLRALLNAVFLGQVLMYTSVAATTVDVTSQLKARGNRPYTAKRATGKVATLLPVDDRHPILGRRAEERVDPENLKLNEDLVLKWASQIEDGTLYKAEMNLTTDDGTKLLFMSRFQDFTSAVDCTLRDGDGLSITFKEKEYLELAKRQWNWLTEDSGNTFWMITNHKDCPREDGIEQYVPYKITDVDYLDDGLTAEFVKSERKTLEEALAEFNFVLQWGQQASAPIAQRRALEKRLGIPGIDIPDIKIPDIKIPDIKIPNPIEEAKKWFEDNWNKAKEKFGDAADKVKGFVDDAGNFNKEDKWELKIELGKEGEKKQLVPDILGTDKQLWCLDCFVRGKFEVHGKIVMEKLDVKEASWSLNPVDFLMRMKMNAILPKSDWQQYQFSIFSFPFAAIDIPVLFHLGPELRIDANFGQKLNEDLDFTFGFEGTLPNEAHVKQNFVDKANIDSAGWDKADAKMLDFELNNGKIDVGLSMGLTAVLSFGYEIFSLGGFEVALKAPLPHWNGNVTTTTDPNGACGDKSPDAPKTAITLNHSIKAGLNFYAGDNVISGGQALVDKELFKWEKKLPTACTALEDDIIDGASNSTTTGDDDEPDFSDDKEIQEAEQQLKSANDELEKVRDEEMAYLDVAFAAGYFDNLVAEAGDLGSAVLALNETGNATLPDGGVNATNPAGLFGRIRQLAEEQSK